MSLWRPFNIDSEDEDVDHTIHDTKVVENKKRIRVGEKEKELIMEAYLRYGDNWKTVLANVKKTIGTIPQLELFYSKEDEKKVLRRIKRIVREETKIQALVYQKARATEPQSASHHVNVDEKPKNTHRAAVSDAVMKKQMRYAEKKTPEERNKRKFDSFEDSESEKSSEDEGQGAKVGAGLTPVKKKKQPTLREVNYQAQIAHTSMCGKASASLDIMNNVLKKLDEKLDEF